MSIKQWNMILVLALIGALSVGGYILYQNHLTQEEARLAQAEQDRIAAEQAAQDQVLAEKVTALTQEFEAFLNAFLGDVSREVKEYRTTRKVLVSLVQPENLRAPEYIEENYKMAGATVMSLRLQMEKIMGLFDDAEMRFQALMVRWPEGRGDAIKTSWRGMKDQQVNLYIGYFSSEQDLLAAMQSLLAFYNEKRDVMQVDMQTGMMVFAEEADAQRHVELKAAVDVLKSMQVELLQ